MNEDCLKLTTYFGERNRANGVFLADALSDLYARHELQTSLVMRGIEGFGARHHLRTDRLLSLSEDLSLVSVAVDTRARIEATIPEVEGLTEHGLVTLERARMLTAGLEDTQLPSGAGEATKLTVYLGRTQRVGLRAAHREVVTLLRRRGIAGATALLGVDGTAYGQRERAKFFGANARVPVMVIAVGDNDSVAGILPELGELVSRPLATLERVQVCKRDGELLTRPQQLPSADSTGLGVWQKLMVYVSERAEFEGRPLSRELIRRLRREGAMGATSLRGIWGYHGDHEPHGDSLWQLRRRVPVLTVIVDRPDQIQRWFDVVDELTAEVGLVTSELVPAFRSAAPGFQQGGLRLARL